MPDLRANTLRLLEKDTVTGNWRQSGAQFGSLDRGKCSCHSKGVDGASKTGQRHGKAQPTDGDGNVTGWIAAVVLAVIRAHAVEAAATIRSAF